MTKQRILCGARFYRTITANNCYLHNINVITRRALNVVKHLRATALPGPPALLQGLGLTYSATTSSFLGPCLHRFRVIARGYLIAALCML